MLLKGKKVAILVEKLYEDLELWYPYYRLKEESATVELVGPEKEVYLSKHNYPAKASLSVHEAESQQWDAIVIPGGYAPDHLRRHPEILRFVKQQFQNGTLVATICHAPWVAISAEIVSGKTMTGFFAIRDDIINAGAKYVDQPVVVDGQLISSRHPNDLPEFCRAIINRLSEKA